MGVLTRKKKKERLIPPQTTRKAVVLEVVHPRGYTEEFRVPIPAGEIMRRYPRYCIARPDVFQFPWIVVRPESLLVPGKVFYLVPYATLDKLMKAKRKQLESLNHRYFHQGQPVKAIRWMNPNHRQDYREGQESDSEGHYKPMFYKTWNKVKRNLQSLDSEDLGIDSPLDSGKSLCDATSGEYYSYCTSTGTVDSDLKSCLRKPDSVQRRVHMKVRF